MSEAAAAGDHEHPAVTDHAGHDVAPVQALLQQRYRQVGQNQGPGEIHRLGHLGRQAIVGGEENQVIDAGIDDTQAGRE